MVFSDGDGRSYYYDGDEEYGKYSEYSDQYNLYQGRRLKMQVTKVKLVIQNTRPALAQYESDHSIRLNMTLAMAS